MQIDVRHWKTVDTISLNTVANIVTAICAVIITIKVL
jgi:hypothetical protein